MVMMGLEEESIELREDFGRYGHQKGGSSGCAVTAYSYSYSTDLPSLAALTLDGIISCSKQQFCLAKTFLLLLVHHSPLQSTNPESTA